jgi:hypothetical protein
MSYSYDVDECRVEKIIPQKAVYRVALLKTPPEIGMQGFLEHPVVTVVEQNVRKVIRPTGRTGKDTKNYA